MPEVQARYDARLRTLLDEIWDADALIADIDRWRAQLRPHLTSNPLAHPGHPDVVGDPRDDQLARFDESGARLIEWIEGRFLAMHRELALGAPDVPPRMREGSICWSDGGRVEAEFEAEWGSHPSPDPVSTGVADLRFEPIDGEPVTFTGGASAGFDNQEGGGTVLLFLPETSGDEPGSDDPLVVVQIVTAPEHFRDATTIGVDSSTTVAAAFRIERPGAPADLVGYLYDATVSFDRAATTAGAPVVGSLVGRLLVPPGGDR